MEEKITQGYAFKTKYVDENREAQKNYTLLNGCFHLGKDTRMPIDLVHHLAKCCGYAENRIINRVGEIFKSIAMKKTVFSLLIILVSIFSNAQEQRMPVPCPGNGSPENCSCSSVFSSCSTNCQKNENGSCACGIFVSTCKCQTDCPGSRTGSLTSVTVNEVRLADFETYIKNEKRSSSINDFLGKLITMREIYQDGSQVEKLVDELAEIVGKFSLADREVINYYLQAIGDHRRI